MPRYAVVWERDGRAIMPYNEELIREPFDYFNRVRRDRIWTTPDCPDRRVALRMAVNATGRDARELRLEVLKEKKR